MRVVFLSDLECLGGAALAASRLARGLAGQGVEVTRIFNNSDSLRTPSVEPVTWKAHYVGPPRALEIGINALRRVHAKTARLAGSEYSARALRKTLASLELDVLHVHSLHNCYWDHDAIGDLDARIPVVWTFHDYWGFSPESYRFRMPDGTDVRVKPDGPNREGAIAKRRRYFDSRARLHLAAPARETARLGTSYLGRDVEVIPYGVPLELFAPVDKKSARLALRIPDDRLLVGFIADHRDDPVKGFDTLRAALSRLDGSRVEAIALGRAQAGTELIGTVRVRSLGYVNNPEFLAIVYSAADVFVVPSRAENLALVCLESIACGTPVVGSAVGGIPDMVVDGETGWLFPCDEVGALAARLDALAKEPEAARRLTDACRKRALRDWPLERQAARYAAIYEQLVSKRIEVQSEGRPGSVPAIA